MSRHPDPKLSQKPSHLSRVDACINFVTTNAVPSAITLQEVKDATAADEAFQSLARVITNQRWHEVGKDVSQYQQIKQELSISNGVILGGTRIIVPEKLQSRMIMLAHSIFWGVNKIYRTRYLQQIKGDNAASLKVISVRTYLLAIPISPRSCF